MKYDCEAEGARVPGITSPELCTVALSICGSSVSNLLHVTLLAHRILRWLPHFLQICAHLLWSHNRLEHKWREGRRKMYLFMYVYIPHLYFYKSVIINTHHPIKSHITFSYVYNNKVFEHWDMLGAFCEAMKIPTMQQHSFWWGKYKLWLTFNIKYVTCIIHNMTALLYEMAMKHNKLEHGLKTVFYVTTLSNRKHNLTNKTVLKQKVLNTSQFNPNTNYHHQTVPFVTLQHHEQQFSNISIIHFNIIHKPSSQSSLKQILNQNFAGVSSVPYCHTHPVN